jgi:hypothetical protein
MLPNNESLTAAQVWTGYELTLTYDSVLHKCAPLVAFPIHEPDLVAIQPNLFEAGGA